MDRPELIPLVDTGKFIDVNFVKMTQLINSGQCSRPILEACYYTIEQLILTSLLYEMTSLVKPMNVEEIHEYILKRTDEIKDNIGDSRLVHLDQESKEIDKLIDESKNLPDDPHETGK